MNQLYIDLTHIASNNFLFEQIRVHRKKFIAFSRYRCYTDIMNTYRFLREPKYEVMKKKNLQAEAGISWASVAKLSKGETEVLMKVCNALECDIADIIELIPR